MPNGWRFREAIQAMTRSGWTNNVVHPKRTATGDAAPLAPPAHRPHHVPTFHRFFSGFPTYFAGCALALGVDTALLMLGVRLGSSLGWAATAGFHSGMLVSYVVSVRYAFRERRLGDARWEFVSFAGIGLCGLVLTQGTLRLLVGELGMSVLLAKGLTAGGVFWFNYAVRKLLLFTRHELAPINP
jgi:putative flippase GtrA